MDGCDTRCTGWLGGVLHRINNIKPYKCNNKRSALLTISRYCIVSIFSNTWWVFRWIKYTTMVCKLFYLKKNHRLLCFDWRDEQKIWSTFEILKYAKNVYDKSWRSLLIKKKIPKFIKNRVKLFHEATTSPPHSRINNYTKSLLQESAKI